MLAPFPDADRPPGADQLARLPDPILLQIFESLVVLSRSQLCSVSRLNRRYHVLADAVLYKKVQFLTPELQLVFSESLSRRPRRGSSIYEVRLAYPAFELSRLTASSSPDLMRPVDGLSRAISAMSNLEFLDISAPESLLHGIGQLFNGPFDLPCLKSCTLFYQCEGDQYWDLQESIHIFAHPTLETLIIKRAKLDHRGFDLIERPHETALKSLHLVECDINDDALGDLLMFPEALKEFVMTQAEDPQPELEESSPSIRDYIIALGSAAHSLETITIDFPMLETTRALALRDFDELKTLRLNWDHQLFGKSSKKPRLTSLGLPPGLETLELFNQLGTDEVVTDLFVNTIQTLPLIAKKLHKLIVYEGEGEDRIPREIEEACKAQTQLELDIIGRMDAGPDLDCARKEKNPLDHDGHDGHDRMNGMNGTNGGDV